jgi:hypothetical protein
MIRTLSKSFNCFKNNRRKSSSKPFKKSPLNEINPEDHIVLTLVSRVIPIDSIEMVLKRYASVNKFDNEEMYRDIFLWSVISGHSEMSFVLLLQLQSRIIASLIAAGITSRLISKKDGYLDQWHKFHKQSENYEQFATECIDACYKRNEPHACQLLLREIPLFGNITCMQVSSNMI